MRGDLDQKEGREQTYEWIEKGLVKQQLVCTKGSYLFHPIGQREQSIIN